MEKRAHALTPSMLQKRFPSRVIIRSLRTTLGGMPPTMCGHIHDPHVPPTG